MNDTRSRLPSAFAGCSLLAAAGAVTAITGAVQHRYALCSFALLAPRPASSAPYVMSRRKDAATDRAVLHRLRASPRQPADELGLRPAAVRLSIQRLASSGQIAANTDRG